MHAATVAAREAQLQQLDAPPQPAPQPQRPVVRRSVASSEAAAQSAAAPASSAQQAGAAQWQPARPMTQQRADRPGTASSTPAPPRLPLQQATPQHPPHQPQPRPQQQQPGQARPARAPAPPQRLMPSPPLGPSLGAGAAPGAPFAAAGGGAQAISTADQQAWQEPGGWQFSPDLPSAAVVGRRTTTAAQRAVLGRASSSGGSMQVVQQLRPAGVADVAPLAGPLMAGQRHMSALAGISASLHVTAGSELSTGGAPLGGASGMAARAAARSAMPPAGPVPGPDGGAPAPGGQCQPAAALPAPSSSNGNSRATSSSSGTSSATSSSNGSSLQAWPAAAGEAPAAGDPLRLPAAAALGCSVLPAILPASSAAQALPLYPPVAAAASLTQR